MSPETQARGDRRGLRLDLTIRDGTPRSAMSLGGRPVLAAAWADLDSGHADALAVAALDRLAGAGLVVVAADASRRPLRERSWGYRWPTTATTRRRLGHWSRADKSGPHERSNDPSDASTPACSHPTQPPDDCPCAADRESGSLRQTRRLDRHRPARTLAPVVACHSNASCRKVLPSHQMTSTSSSWIRATCRASSDGSPGSRTATRSMISVSRLAMVR